MTPPDAILSIFISHSHKDQDFGIRLVQDLRALFSNKEAIWFDTAGGLSGGIAWRREIVDQVTKRPVFIVILSPDAISSEWVNFELDMAWVLMLSKKGPSKLIIPLLHRPSTLSADLNTLQIISFLPPTSYEAGLDELITAINRFAPGNGYAPVVKPSTLPPDAGKPASSILQKTKEQWLIEGHSHYFARSYTEALAAYEQALQLDPTFAEAYNGKGRAYYYLARYHEALASFEQAIRLKPDYVDPLMKDLQGSLKQESVPGLAADQFTSISISTESIYRHDLLLVLLKEKLHLNNFSIIAGSIAFAAAYFGLSPLTGISFGLRGAALVHTLSAFLQTFLVVPLLYSLYLQIPTSIAGFFNTLIVNGVISEHRPDRPGSESFVTFLQNFTARVNNSWLTVSASLMAGSYLLYRFLMDAARLGQPSFWLEAVAFLVIYFPLLYATLSSILRLLITLISTNSLFTSFSTHIYPLHPDGSAGLGEIARMLRVSVSLLAISGIAVLVTHPSIFIDGPGGLPFLNLLLPGITYVILSTVFLTGWLVLPHQLMLEARNQTLQPFVDGFQQAIERSKPTDDADAIQAETERLKNLQRRYQLLLETFPTWPVEVKQILLSLVLLSIPVLLALILPYLFMVLHLQGA